jgi:ribosomal protein S27AE
MAVDSDAESYEDEKGKRYYLLTFLEFPEKLYHEKLMQLIRKKYQIYDSEIRWESSEIEATIRPHNFEIELISVLTEWINKMPEMKGLLKLEGEHEKYKSGRYEFYPKVGSINHSIIELFCTKKSILPKCILCGNASFIQEVPTKHFTLRVDCGSCGTYLYTYIPGNRIERRFEYFYKIFNVNPNEIIKLVKKYNSKGDLYQLKETPK